MKDLGDGSNLVLLLGLLGNFFVPFHEFKLQPETLEDRVANFELALDFMSTADIPDPKIEAQGTKTQYWKDEIKLCFTVLSKCFFYFHALRPRNTKFTFFTALAYGDAEALFRVLDLIHQRYRPDIATPLPTPSSEQNPLFVLPLPTTVESRNQHEIATSAEVHVVAEWNAWNCDELCFSRIYLHEA